MLRPQGLVGEPIPKGQVVGTWNTSILGLFWPLGLKKKSLGQGLRWKKPEETACLKSRLPPTSPSQVEGLGLP